MIRAVVTLAVLMGAQAFLGRPMASPQRLGLRAGAGALDAKLAPDEKVILIGVAADSGCGKSTFMRRLTNIFGGEQVGPLGGGFDNGGWETNSLVSDLTTVLCLDDFHLNDRQGRKESGLSALHPKENNFDLMYEQLKALKEGKAVEKPIYNHVNGTLDTPETIQPTPIVIVEGLHPMYDERVRELLDFSIYLDISDDIKKAWKIQRDMKERGHSLESILASIEARKPDFDAYVGPQREFADITLQVLPTETTEDEEGKLLKVRMIQRTDNKALEPVYVLDQGSKVAVTPDPSKVAPGASPTVTLGSGPDTWYGSDVCVVEMDGAVKELECFAAMEAMVSASGAKYEGEVADLVVANKDAPGSDNGTGFFQTLTSLKLREVYEKLTGKTVEATKPELAEA